LNRFENLTEIQKSKSVFTVLFITVFLDLLGFTIVIPYLFFYAQSLGASEFTFGLLLTSYSLMQFIFTPIWGRLSDRYGRRPILLISLFGSGISLLIFGLASSIWLLFASRIVAGIMGSTINVAQAYVTDITAPEARLKSLGLLGAAFGLGFILGPAIGGTLSGLYGYAIPSFVASALAFANFILAYFRLPESRVFSENNAVKKESPMSLKEKGLYLLLAVFFSFTMAFVFMETTFAPFAQIVFHYGPFETGLLFFYIGIVSVITQAAMIPILSKKYVPQTLLLMGLVSLCFGLTGLALSTSLPGLLISTALMAFGGGLVNPSVSTLISLKSSAREQGESLGIGQSVSSLARVVSPSMGTYVDEFGISFGVRGLALYAASAIILITLPAALVLWRQKEE
jgi:multidrug resistance protein